MYKLVIPCATIIFEFEFESTNKLLKSLQEIKIDGK